MLSLLGRPHVALAVTMTLPALACSSGHWPPLRTLPGARELPPEATPRTGYAVAEPKAGRIGYSGLLTEAGLEALKKADREGVTTLLVRSQGGEGQVGMQFGDWVHARGLDVVVVDYCVSSCASFVFTAGWHKTILPGAIVAWQGNHRLRGAAAQAEHDNAADEFKELRREEDAFFRRIGVNECICRVGYDSPLGASPSEASRSGQGSFTLMPEDMARFGVGDVTAGPRGKGDVSPVVWKWLEPRFVSLPAGADAQSACTAE